MKAKEISQARLMSIALQDPSRGYYRRGEASAKNASGANGAKKTKASKGAQASSDLLLSSQIGGEGDFITAPEISQMFGEMLASWSIAIWRALGSPQKFMLVEAGPGRGTLMLDFLRAAKVDPDFLKAASLHLIEVSPTFRQQQKEQLAPYSKMLAPSWHNSLNELPKTMPLIMIANEFLDALPTQTYKKEADAWKARHYKKAGTIWRKVSPSRKAQLQARYPQAAKGEMVELSPHRSRWMLALTRRLKKQSGAALVIDYGYVMPALKVSGDTLQAVAKHKSQAIDANAIFNKKPIAQDITTSIDFLELSRLLRGANVEAVQLQTQREFLLSCGILQRLQKLTQNVDANTADTLKNGVARLVDERHMGFLFKVLSVGHSQPTS